MVGLPLWQFFSLWISNSFPLATYSFDHGLTLWLADPLDYLLTLCIFAPRPTLYDFRVSIRFCLSDYTIAIFCHNRVIYDVGVVVIQISAIAGIRNALAYATHTFFQSHDFLYIHTPIITTSDCEGAGEMFQVTTLINYGGNPKKDGKIDYTQDFLPAKHFWPCPGNYRLKHMPVPSVVCIHSGPRFEQKTPTHQGILLNFGWWNPKLHLRIYRYDTFGLIFDC